MRRIGQAEAERRADVAVPRAEEHLADALALALGRHHHVHAPRGVELAAVHLQPHRHRRVLADDRRALARDPDDGRAAGVVGVAPVLPVPPQTAGVGRVVAEHPPVQRIHGAPCPRQCSGRCRPWTVERHSPEMYCTCPIAMSCVSRLSRIQLRSGVGSRPERSGQVQVLVERREARRGDLSAQPLDAHEFEQVVGLPAVLPRDLDERVLIGPLARASSRRAARGSGTSQTTPSGRSAGATESAPSAAAGARRQTTGRAPSTGTCGRPASAPARTRAGTAARRRHARSRRARTPSRTCRWQTAEPARRPAGTGGCRCLVRG